MRALLALLCHAAVAAAFVRDGGLLKLAPMGNVLAANGCSLQPDEETPAMSKQIEVASQAWAGSIYFSASDPATGHVRAPAKPPRNLWRRVEPNNTNFWVAVVPAATGTNFVAPYNDASQDQWDGWGPRGRDTIIISAGPTRATAETVAHFHEDTPGTPVVAPDVALDPATHGAALAAGGPYRLGRDFTARHVGYNQGNWREHWSIKPRTFTHSDDERRSKKRPAPRTFTRSDDETPVPGVEEATNKCFRCGGIGHWARDCPKKRKP